jgi:hypothetical protein
LGTNKAKPEVKATTTNNQFSSKKFTQ